MISCYEVSKEGSFRDPSSRNLFHFILAYVDDMLVSAKDAGTLQALLNLLNNLATKIGLIFNPRECVTLDYFCKPPDGCRDTSFNIAGNETPYTQDGTAVIFIGKTIGAFISKDTVTIETLKQRAMKTMTSKLAPWQKLDCLKTFFYPSLLFLMMDKSDR